jgi:hypothetical protein
MPLSAITAMPHWHVRLGVTSTHIRPAAGVAPGPPQPQARHGRGTVSRRPRPAAAGGRRIQNFRLEPGALRNPGPAKAGDRGRCFGLKLQVSLDRLSKPAILAPASDRYLSTVSTLLSVLRPLKRDPFVQAPALSSAEGSKTAKTASSRACSLHKESLKIQKPCASLKRQLTILAKKLSMLACTWRPLLVLACAVALVHVPLHSAFLSYPSAVRIHQPEAAMNPVSTPTLDGLGFASCSKASADVEANKLCREGTCLFFVRFYSPSCHLKTIIPQESPC